MRGFSLLEVLIVLMVISVLAASSLPLYTTHLIHAERLHAEMQLLRLASALEQYFLQNNSYENADLQTLGFSSVLKGKYQLEISRASATEFSVRAIPLAAQSQDSQCGILELNARGEKFISGSGSVDECWG